MDINNNIELINVQVADNATGYYQNTKTSTAADAQDFKTAYAEAIDDTDNLSTVTDKETIREEEESIDDNADELVASSEIANYNEQNIPEVVDINLTDPTLVLEHNNIAPLVNQSQHTNYDITDISSIDADREALFEEVKQAVGNYHSIIQSAIEQDNSVAVNEVNLSYSMAQVGEQVQQGNLSQGGLNFVSLNNPQIDNTAIDELNAALSQIDLSEQGDSIDASSNMTGDNLVNTTDLDTDISAAMHAQENSAKQDSSFGGNKKQDNLTQANLMQPSNVKDVQDTTKNNNIQAVKYKEIKKYEDNFKFEEVQADDKKDIIVQDVNHRLIIEPRITTRELKPEIALKEHIQDPAWGNNLGSKIIWMAQGDIKSASININPPELGPIEIDFSVDDKKASLLFSSYNYGIKETLESSIPKLREILSNSGLDLVNVNINMANNSHQERRNLQHSRSQFRSSALKYGNILDSGINLTPQVNRGLTSALIDVFA